VPGAFPFNSSSCSSSAKSLRRKGAGFTFPFERIVFSPGKILGKSVIGEAAVGIPSMDEFQGLPPLRDILTPKHQVQETKKILERINHGKLL